ncbi:PaaI family thioesterase [Seongchinamella sediminis]|uniref:Acyl-coenzyme A thioesterase THEM4 n=1 Tax=Seongchinamella sediminis TaxID=2283635 RepID=A0A3L7DYV9_9GAMM|nr:PaaI family thioesterase [Seongchinamella sediminis]RLQ21845.1 PaaI family thioesterase [Seongchinamella sediminis]
MNEINDPFASEDITPPISEEWEAKRRVASAIKQLTEVLVTSSPDIQKMHDIAAQLETTAEEFSRSPRLFGRLDWIRSGQHGSFGQVSHELNPIGGYANPIAPPVNAWLEDDKALGHCLCGWVYEGPPGSVHGGFVAAIFDQFMGVAQKLGGRPGMTGYLHVNYHSRTPLNTDLKLEARLVKADGRKTTIVASMWADEVLTASCEALFVEPRSGIHSLENQQRG